LSSPVATYLSETAFGMRKKCSLLQERFDRRKLGIDKDGGRYECLFVVSCGGHLVPPSTETHHEENRSVVVRGRGG